MKNETVDETLSTCPTCGGLTPVMVMCAQAGVEYSGTCPHHGTFVRRGGYVIASGAPMASERGRE